MRDPEVDGDACKVMKSTKRLDLHVLAAAPRVHLLCYLVCSLASSATFLFPSSAQHTD